MQETQQLDQDLQALCSERDALLHRAEEARQALHDIVPIIRRVTELENRIWDLGTAYLKSLARIDELVAENRRLQSLRREERTPSRRPVHARASA